jgi:hypothetical protein
MLHAPCLRIDHKRLHQPVIPDHRETLSFVSYGEVRRRLHAGAYFGFVCPIAELPLSGKDAFIGTVSVPICPERSSITIVEKPPTRPAVGTESAQQTLSLVTSQKLSRSQMAAGIGPP